VPIFNSARRTWIAAYRASEAGLLPHTLWQSTDGQIGANRSSPSLCRASAAASRSSGRTTRATGRRSPTTWAP